MPEAQDPGNTTPPIDDPAPGGLNEPGDDDGGLEEPAPGDEAAPGAKPAPAAPAPGAEDPKSTLEAMERALGYDKKPAAQAPSPTPKPAAQPRQQAPGKPGKPLSEAELAMPDEIKGNQGARERFEIGRAHV